MKRWFAGLMVSLALLVLVVPAAQAQLRPGVFTGLAEEYFTGEGGPFQGGSDLQNNLPTAIGSIISIFLSLIGVVLLVIIVYAGYLWLTAGGNDDQVSHAKQLIKNGVIGMVIALSAFILTQFIVTAVTRALGSGTAAPAGSGTAGNTVDPQPPAGGAPSGRR